MLGVSSAPAYGELAWAEEGEGAFLNEAADPGERGGAAREAIVSTGNLKTLTLSPRWERFGELIAQREPHPRLR